VSRVKYFLQKHGDCERPCIMWAWADRLRDDYIVHQIEKFKEVGIDDFYVHPSWMSEYDNHMSEFFLDKIKLIVETAESLGMRFSLYDEYDWASGICGGQVIAEHPELRMTAIKWARADVQAGEATNLWFRGKLLAVQVQYLDKVGNRADVTKEAKVDVFGEEEGGRVVWVNKNTCTAQVFVFSYDKMDGYSAAAKWSSFLPEPMPGFVDTMHPDSIKQFLSMTHDKYLKALGEERFGTTIRRAFTDETPMGPLFVDDATRPYSVALEEEFYKEHGYRLSDDYIALTNTCECAADMKVLYDYYNTCTRLFNENWLRPYAAWCHEHNLQLTGHLSGAGHMHFQGLQMGDFYRSLSNFDVPGVDSILSKKYVNDIGFGITPQKMTASLAKFQNKDRVICETFSGSGWDCNLEDMKRVINRLMLSGVTYIMYMTASYSQNEGRKNLPIGYPPSHGYNNPLFKHYEPLTDYTAIRSFLLSQTKPHSHTLILTPQIDAWTHMEDWRWMCKRHEAWAITPCGLSYNNVDYDMFFEFMTEGVTVENGQIVINGYRYDTIILPSIRCSNQFTMDLLESFAKQGGRIVFIDSIPTLAVDTGKEYDLAKACGLDKDALSVFTGDRKDYATYENSHVMLINMGHYKSGVATSTDLINMEIEEFKCRDVFWKDLSRFARNGDPGEKVTVLSMPNGVNMARRTAKGLYCCLVSNDTAQEAVARLRVHSDDTLTLLKGTQLYDVCAEDGIVTITLAPHDMSILLLTETGVSVEGISKGQQDEAPCGETTELVMKKGWTVKRSRPNELPLPIRYLTKAEPCGKLDPAIAKLAETAEVPYAIQEFPAGMGLDFGSGYAAFARFEILDMPKTLELFTEIVDDAELWLNGTLLSGYKTVMERGPRDKVTDITGLVKPGTNVLVMIHRMPAWAGPHQMPISIVRGDFRLDDAERIVADYDAIDVNRYFTQQGLRYYQGELCYENSFTLDADAKKVIVKLETSEVAEVIVNGVSAGVMCWHPYEADITSLCKQGENKLEIVYTTTSEAAMVLEEMVYISQGVSEYRDKVAPQAIGSATPPVITIIQ